MMADKISFFIFFIMWVVFIIGYFKIYKDTHKKIDGVKTIDGITYKVKNTNIEYVMGRFAATRVSKIIKDKTFIKISDTKGQIEFGALSYPLLLNNSDGDIGATYEIICEQVDDDVLIHISYIGKSFVIWKDTGVGDALNQAYHRWFKELLDVEVYSLPKEKKVS